MTEKADWRACEQLGVRPSSISLQLEWTGKRRPPSRRPKFEGDRALMSRDLDDRRFDLAKGFQIGAVRNAVTQLRGFHVFGPVSRFTPP